MWLRAQGLVLKRTSLRGSIHPHAKARAFGSKSFSHLWRISRSKSKKNMSLRLWRKTKKFSYSSGRSKSSGVLNPWHTISVSSKRIAFLMKKGKHYSPELRSPISALSLYSTNFFKESTFSSAKYTANSFSSNSIGSIVENHFVRTDNNNKISVENTMDYSCLFFHKNNIFRRLSVSSFWMFKNPIAVPGAYRIRRSKSAVYNTSSSQNLILWLHRIGFRKLNTLYAYMIRSQNPYNATGFMTAIEILWPVLLIKIGFFPTVGGSKNTIKYNEFFVNAIKFPQKKNTTYSLAVPADVFSLSSSPLHYAPYLKKFHQKICKNLLSSILLFICCLALSLCAIYILLSY